ncbi:SHOCT domain-containing protein [Natronosalvus vescus]|uniref:SHOCT domain-containing protein n=1 Tax=Natronosalvus vescus TaxID=2953881 RepID=UPI002090FE88|nr:SHOCT domain-containing protein [Natronosalvus vescus]
MTVSLGDRFAQNATAITSTLITGLWLGLLVGDIGGNLWLAVLIVGYVAVIPAVSMLFDDEEWEGELEEDTETPASSRNDHAADNRAPPAPDGHVPEEDALETIRRRYARGELSDEQFEHKLERLLDVETLEDVESRYGTGSADRNDERRLSRERE